MNNLTQSIRTLTLIGIALLSFSCGSKKDDPTPPLQADIQEINIKYDESVKIELRRGTQTIDFTEVTSSSSDEFVGRVTGNGVFVASHIGETDLTIVHQGDLIKIPATVTPRQQLFQEPNIEFGQDKSYIKHQESRVLQFELPDALIYRGENSNLYRLTYLFENGRYIGSMVEIPVSSAMIERVVEFYRERYNYKGQVDEYFIHTNKNEQVMMGLTVDGGYLKGIYAPNSAITGRAIIQKLDARLSSY